MKKLSLIWVILLTIYCVGSVFAQENLNKTTPPCENYDKKDFEGEKINLNFINTELKDILNYISEIYGCNFVIDKSIKLEPITVKIDNVPWNIALGSILRSQNLTIEFREKILRVKNYEWWQSHGKQKEKSVYSIPIYTEFIKLNYLSVLPAGYGECTFEKSYSTLPPSKVVKLIIKLLSRQGSVETDSRSNSLIITDTKKRLDLILKKIKEWDKPNTNLD